jgi:site-specific recombinase XerD
LVQSFFAEHLTQQRALSARTVAAYRDAFMLFLEFVEARLHKPPTSMLLTDITPALILACDRGRKSRPDEPRARRRGGPS